MGALKQEDEKAVEEHSTALEEPAGTNGDTPEAGTEEASLETAEAGDLAAAIAERDRALAENAELLEKRLRAQAEFENTRKRIEREYAEFKQYAAMETIAALLPIVDDFERAVKTPDLDPEFRKGLELIHKRIVEVFERAGLKPVVESGSFDPSVHQAVDRAPAENDDEDQQILEVYQKGYRFKDRLLRASMVKVAVKE